MKCLLQDFLGVAIRDRQERRVLARVRDAIINPANGEIVAFFVDPKRHYILPTVDIVRATKAELWIEHADIICPLADIVRIQHIAAQQIPICGNQVINLSRQKLGRVMDVEFETKGWIMTKLDVAKQILHIPTERKLIDTRQIVRITKSEITVQDASIPAGKKTKRATRDAAIPEPSICKSK